MPIAVVTTLIGFFSGLTSVFITQYIQMRMGFITKAYDRKWEAIWAAYWPAIANLEVMIDDHPNNGVARAQLLAIYQQHGAKLSRAAREHVRVAIGDGATLDDLARARDILEDIVDQ
jgi:hypothetical protein